MSALLLSWVCLCVLFFAGEGRDIELRHQRNPDVVFDYVRAVQGEPLLRPPHGVVGPSAVWWRGPSVLMQLTLLPACVCVHVCRS